MATLNQSESLEAIANTLKGINSGLAMDLDGIFRGVDAVLASTEKQERDLSRIADALEAISHKLGKIAESSTVGYPSLS